jgi:hypothetical protein
MTEMNQVQDVLSGYLQTTSGLSGSWTATATALPESVAGPEDFTRRTRFDDLVRQWRGETRYSSSLTRIVMHPAYQAVIGMGEAALPLIFEDLKRNGGHWFWALHAITQADPALAGDDFTAAAHAWLAWGQAHGYL